VHKIGDVAYTVGKKCAKNCCKQTVLVQLIAEDIVTQCSYTGNTPA